MAWTFNPFSGTFDQKGSGGGGGSSYLEGEVQNFSALPTATPPAIDAAYLVREAEGAWLLSRKPAGIYIRVATTGTRATDWQYAGEFPDVFSDDKFVLYDETDSSKNLVFQLSGITTGTTRTLTAPDRNGRVSVSDYRLLSVNANAVTGDKVAADTTSAAWTLTLPATPSNGDTITVLDYAGTFDTNNLTIARNGSNIESLAENMVCEVEDAAFTLVFVGSTVGWKVVPLSGTAIAGVISNPAGVSGADAITNIMSLTQAEYNAIGSPDPTTLFIITDL
jgi:hypothetical protein